MMQVEELAIPKKKAEAEYQALVGAFRQHAKLRKEEIRQDLRRVYGHLRHGKKIVDVYESFKTAGLNKNRNPKLAICRADAKQCYCYKDPNGAAIFSFESGVTVARKTKGDIHTPNETFQWNEDGSKFVLWKERHIRTLVPIIPAKILVNEVKILLRNFHILWEVEPNAWKTMRPPRDPILLRRLTPNLFGVLATWDLTPLERAVIRGRL